MTTIKKQDLENRTQSAFILFYSLFYGMQNVLCVASSVQPIGRPDHGANPWALCRHFPLSSSPDRGTSLLFLALCFSGRPPFFVCCHWLQTDTSCRHGAYGRMSGLCWTRSRTRKRSQSPRSRWHSDEVTPTLPALLVIHSVVCLLVRGYDVVLLFP